MFQQMKKRIKNEKGLTLIELLAVIVILAIIAAIAVPAIGNIINNSKDRSILSEASNALAAAKIAVTDGACKAAADTCSSAELDPYYDGDITGVSVTWADTNGNRAYSITFPELNNVKDKTRFGVSGNTMTEADLLVNLEK